MRRDLFGTRPSPGPRLAIGILAFVLSFAGCTCTTPVHDVCGHTETGAEVCTPCERDADCGLTFSCCGPSYFCHHKKDSISICMLGCPDRIGPDPSCTCVKGRCRGE